VEWFFSTSPLLLFLKNPNEAKQSKRILLQKNISREIKALIILLISMVIHIHKEKKVVKSSKELLSCYPLLDLVDQKIYSKKYYQRHLEKRRELYNGPFSPTKIQVGGFLERSSSLSPSQSLSPISQMIQEWAFHMIGAFLGVLLLIIFLVKFHIKIF
jgi:hypothetical protein